MGTSMMQDVELREFRRQDLEAAKSLIDETIKASYSIYPEEVIEHWTEDHHSREHISSRARDGYTIVLEYKGRIIGTGTLLGRSIQGVFIHPSHQRRGFGKLIMHKLEKQAMADGIGTLELTSTLVSKQFYDSLGYATLREDHFSAGAKQEFRYYRMMKRI